MKQTIVRKDGITYVREVKETKELNTFLHIRINCEELNALKEKAKKEGVEYSELARTYLKKGLEEEL